ncbi:protein kinase domain-containing protein [Sorangium sp. So ce204]|uniref:protein kinase domain-containing protein n=1 Tax=Sorangium sp. So ce204 TaxID=3133288 RepID=UPI003F6020D1
MVAAGEIWEGHELLREERGMVRHFLARQLGDTGTLVWLHIREGSSLDEGVFTEEMARLQRLSDDVPEVVRVLYGGVKGSVAWAATPVLSDAIPLIDAVRGIALGPAALKVLIDVGRCLVRAHERSVIHGAVSPDRVFVVGDGRYAITHFGFVHLFQLGAEEASQDPYGYAPPELISGGRVGRRTDVYGFGTIMYELLCQRPLSTWTSPPSLPVGMPPMLQWMIKISLAENPERRQPSIEKLLAALTPFTRAWEELGEPPGPAHADILAEPPGARPEPDEGAPVAMVAMEDEVEPFTSDEEGGRAVAPPTPRPSEAPDTVKSAIPRDARGEATLAPPLAPLPPPVPDVPDLDPMLPGPPAPSIPPRPSGTPARRSRARSIAAVFVLALLLGSAVAVLLWRTQPLRAAAPHLARTVLVAALRAGRLPSPRPPDRRPEPPPPPPAAAAPPIAPRPRPTRPAAPPRQALKSPAREFDPCDGIIPCQNVHY